MYSALRHGNVFVPTYFAGLKTLPWQSRSGALEYVEPPSSWMMSPVWLTTTSRITFIPRLCAQSTKSAKSWSVPRCGSTRVKSSPQ